MLQAPFPVNAARAGDLRAVTAWRQRCATTEANPVDARFPFDEWRPLQLAAAEGDVDERVDLELLCGWKIGGRGWWWRWRGGGGVGRCGEGHSLAEDKDKDVDGAVVADDVA